MATASGYCLTIGFPQQLGSGSACVAALVLVHSGMAHLNMISPAFGASGTAGTAGTEGTLGVSAHPVRPPAQSRAAQGMLFDDDI